MSSNRFVKITDGPRPEPSEEEITASLSQSEESELQRYEAVIERGIETFVEVGQALMTIREKRLYRASHSTFEDYCQERWGMNASRARQLISAAMVTDTIANYVNESVTIVTLPATESQARPLAKLPPEQQGEAWQRAVETAPGGKVTAAHVAEVVEEMFHETETKNESTQQATIFDAVKKPRAPRTRSAAQRLVRIRAIIAEHQEQIAMAQGSSAELNAVAPSLLQALEQIQRELEG